MQVDLLVKDCCLLDSDLKLVKGQNILISNGKIENITPNCNEITAKETLHADGNLVMPGFVDAHTHVCQQLLRGRTTDEYPMIWTRFLVPFESALTQKDVTISTELACLEMIKAGITSFADAGGVHMEQAASVVEKSGIRAALCRSTMDMGANIPNNMKDTAENHFRHTRQLYDDWQGKGDGRIDIWYGIRQVMTCSKKLLEETAYHAKSLKTGIHAHLCEHKEEVIYCLHNYKKRPVEFLEECGVLGENLLTAHNVMLSESDITLLAKKGVKIVHCPQANFTNHGFPKVPRILEVGCDVGIGNDGASAVALDMFEQLRVFKNGTLANWGIPVFDPTVLPTASLIKMATIGGAAALQKKDKLGKIEKGYLADIIVINIHQPHILPTQNIAHTLLACGNGRDVTDVIINGKVVMKNRELLTLDEKRIMKESQTAMNSIINRAGI